MMVGSNIVKEMIQVYILVVLNPFFRRLYLPADSQHGSMIIFCVIQAVQQMNRSRPRCTHTYTKITGKLTDCACSKSARFLVPYMDKPDFILFPDCFKKCIDCAAGDSENK